MDAGLVEVVRIATQRHVVTRREARRLGVSEKQLDRALADGLLEPLHPGVFVLAGTTRTPVTRIAAAAAISDGVASHRSAGVLHDVRRVPRYRPEITVITDHHPMLPGVHAHRTKRLDPIDVTVVDGIRCTSLARTLFDLAGVLPFEWLETGAQDALIRRRTTLPDLFAVLDGVGRRGRRGTAAFRILLREALPDERVESLLEAALHDLIRHHGFVPQQELLCSDGRLVRLDFALPDLRIAVEGEGLRWHGTAESHRAGMARARSIRASGWDLYPYGWADVHETPGAVRAEVDRVVTAARRLAA